MECFSWSSSSAKEVKRSSLWGCSLTLTEACWEYRDSICGSLGFLLLRFHGHALRPAWSYIHISISPPFCLPIAYSLSQCYHCLSLCVCVLLLCCSFFPAVSIFAFSLPLSLPSHFFIPTFGRRAKKRMSFLLRWQKLVSVCGLACLSVCSLTL